MDINEDICFLTKPKINPEKLAYVLNTKKVYVNLFEIRLNKKLTLSKKEKELYYYILVNTKTSFKFFKKVITNFQILGQDY